MAKLQGSKWNVIEVDASGKEIRKVHRDIGEVKAKQEAIAYNTAKDGTWIRPKGWRLPKNGTWENGVGNSNFMPHDPVALGLNPGDVIPFKRGKPDFSEWVFEEPIKFDFTLSGYHDIDRPLAIERLAEAKGWSNSRVEKWLKEEGLRIHHSGQKEIQLIRKDLHDGVRHQGDAFEARERNRKGR